MYKRAVVRRGGKAEATLYALNGTYLSYVSNRAVVRRGKSYLKITTSLKKKTSLENYLLAWS